MYKIKDIAHKLNIHPRTVLRIWKDEPNPYWTPKYDPEMDMDDLMEFCENFNTTMDAVENIMSDQDYWLKPDEAAAMIAVPTRTFYYRHYTPVARKGKTVRFSKKYMSQFLPRSGEDAHNNVSE